MKTLRRFIAIAALSVWLIVASGRPTHANAIALADFTLIGTVVLAGIAYY